MALYRRERGGLTGSSSNSPRWLEASDSTKGIFDAPGLGGKLVWRSQVSKEGRFSPGACRRSPVARSARVERAACRSGQTGRRCQHSAETRHQPELDLLGILGVPVQLLLQHPVLKASAEGHQERGDSLGHSCSQVRIPVPRASGGLHLIKSAPDLHCGSVRRPHDDRCPLHPLPAGRQAMMPRTRILEMLRQREVGSSWEAPVKGEQRQVEGQKARDGQ